MQNNKAKVWGLAGLNSSFKLSIKKRFADLDKSLFLLIDLNELTDKVFEPGAEGHRQIMNFFGTEFLDKKERLKKKKLWKFVYENQNKLKILYYLLDPLLMDAVTKEIDLHKGKTILVFADSFLYEYWNQVLAGVFWVNTNKEEFLQNLTPKDLPCSADQYFYIMEKVFIKPKNLEIVDLDKDLNVAFLQIESNLK